ncbi:hypothetical protein FACS1894139_19200 [Planctomycetales bacterium]|nr:hypothetical protein FACS1894107_02710 [Planctomycetales bacterium]GHS98939.1 hypothetical protein FACS1894108_07990 [Planctomycetales bacterium]GHT09052.1 hypothetical protein FACS1894139_19200 [Planctomycetales bacterium]
MAYEIYTYQTASGRDPVGEFLDELRVKTDKANRVRTNKIYDCFDALARHGTSLGKPVIDHLDGEIYELRPLRDRILFAAWVDRQFVLLHHFYKTTQKTPRREIELAQQRLADLKRRNGNEKITGKKIGDGA